MNISVIKQDPYWSILLTSETANWNWGKNKAVPSIVVILLTECFCLFSLSDNDLHSYRHKHL